MIRIGLVGGTGDIGSGLAVRLARRYAFVIVGSRIRAKSEARIKEILEEKGNPSHLSEHLRSGTNDEAVSSSDVVIVTVPYESAIPTIKDLSSKFRRGQVLISAVAAVSKVGKEFVPIRDRRSVSESFKDMLPEGVDIATAFQTVPSGALYNDIQIDADVFVACETGEVFSKIHEIISSIEGLRPLYVGTLRLAGELEGLTAILLNVQIRNKLRNPTFKVQSCS